MARPTIPCDKDKLIVAIAKAEEKDTYTTRDALNEAVAKIYGELNPDDPPITKGVVYLRIRDWGLTVKTKPGRRGRGGPITDSDRKAMNAGRVRKSKSPNPRKKEAIAALIKVTEPRFLPLVAKISKGSRVAAVQLNCLACVGYKTAEVRNCSSTGCAMWLFRPYQGAVQDEEKNEKPDTPPPAIEV